MRTVPVNGFEINVFESVDIACSTIIANYLDKPNIAIAINPEKIIQSRESLKVKEIIDACDFRYPDGVGVVRTMKAKSGLDIARIPGCELWEKLMIHAGKDDIPVYILGAGKIVNEETVLKLKKKYGVNVVGCHDGYFDDDSLIIENIKKSKAKIITVALGSPKQEEFMFKCKKKELNAFMMGVGGTYDVFTGKIKRAPYLIQKINCEWLYRLAFQPTRLFWQLRLVKYIYWHFFKKI